ncbi:MAG: hypothetical protein NZ921_05475 [Candidatus Caldarchaeum sp.]|nr:hypothetical protein [Candidatus Caldarchaeum sp.]MCX8201746.1 hypothetical protein [Candidatus Caldarchaeum sp.]
MSVVSLTGGRIRQSTRLLRTLMWGCAVGLVADHVVNGELVPWPPFLTGWNPAAGILPILEEVVFVGGAVTLSVTAFWGLLLAAPKLMALSPFQKFRATRT